MKKRYKTLIGFFITGIILIFIFIITKDNKIYYLSLGDSLAKGVKEDGTNANGYASLVADYLKNKDLLEFYTNKYSNKNYRSIDVLNDITNNKTITFNDKKIPIKHALIKADVVTLSVGMNDLFYKLNLGITFDSNGYQDINDYIDEVMLDIDKLLLELRKSCKEEIMVLGYYNPFINYSNKLANSIEPTILYANLKLKQLVNKYDMTYVDIHDTFLSNPGILSKKLNIYPNDKGYEAISNKIIMLINEKTLAK